MGRVSVKTLRQIEQVASNLRDLRQKIADDEKLLDDLFLERAQEIEADRRDRKSVGYIPENGC